MSGNFTVKLCWHYILTIINLSIQYHPVTIVNLTVFSDNCQFIKHYSVIIVNLTLFSDNCQFIKHNSVIIVNLTLFTDNHQFDTLKLWPLGPLRAGPTVGTVVLSYTPWGVATPHPPPTHPSGPPLGGPEGGVGGGWGVWLNNQPCGSHTNLEIVKLWNFDCHVVAG